MPKRKIAVKLLIFKIGLIEFKFNQACDGTRSTHREDADTGAHNGIGIHGDSFKSLHLPGRNRVLEFQQTHSLQDGGAVMTFTSRVRRLSYPLTFVTALLTAAAAPAQAENYESWGVGYGMSYAYLGANVDYRVAPNLYLAGAIGTGINELGLAAGGRYYVLPSLFETARARVSAMYGTYGGVTHISAGTNSKHKEDFAGLAIGMGILLFSDNEGVDFDIYYADTRAAKDRFDRYNAAGARVSRDGLDPINVSLGYRRRFQ